MELVQAYFPSLIAWQDNIGLRPDDMQGQLMLETMVTASSWIGTGLFASIAMRRTAPMLRILAGLLTAALIIKAAVAELQFPDDNAFNWLSEGPLRVADEFAGAGAAVAPAALAAGDPRHAGAGDADRADQRAAVEPVRVDFGTRLAHGPLHPFQQPRAMAGLAMAAPGVLLHHLAIRAGQRATPAGARARRRATERAVAAATEAQQESKRPQS
jgi:hypothetical protein